MIWKKPVSLEILNARGKETLVSHLDIMFTSYDDNSLTAVMPVKDTIKQPLGIVHGGANCVIAETVGSVAANFACPEDYYAVGQSIFTTHLKAVRNGKVTCVGEPVRIGNTFHVWKLSTFDDSGELTSLTTLSMSVKKKLG